MLNPGDTKVFLALSVTSVVSTTATTTPSTLETKRSSPHVPWISKKTWIVLVILLICVVIALGINLVNLHSDYRDLMDFYRGYLGRKLLIAEGRLTSKEFLKELKRRQKQETQREIRPYQNGIEETNRGISFIRFYDKEFSETSFCNTLTETTSLTTTMRIHPSSTLVTINNQSWPYDETIPNDKPHDLRQTADDLIGISHWSFFVNENFPLEVESFIEDHNPEWIDLDYSIDVSEPPTSFEEFVIQYDWNLFPKISDPNELCRRKTLFSQFRLWKKKKRRLWNIIVTERAKKEMAEQEREGKRGERIH